MMPGLLVLLAHHVPGGVLEEDQGDVDLVGQLDELGGLVGLLGEEHTPVVGQHPDRVAVDGRPPGDQAGAVEGLELVEAGAVDHPGQDLAGVEGDLGVGRGDAQQLVGVVDRLVGRQGRARPPLAPVQPAHDLAAQADGVDLVDGQVVGQAGHPGVHGGPAQLLVGRLLAGGHLHQRRPAQEDLGPLLDHHDVVAHARDVGPAGRGVAEDQGHGGERRGRAPGQVTEGPAPGDEQLGLGREVGAPRLHQVDRPAAGSGGRCPRPGRPCGRCRGSWPRPGPWGRWPRPGTRPPRPRRCPMTEDAPTG